MTPTNIFNQHEAGLISKAEALQELEGHRLAAVYDQACADTHSEWIRYQRRISDAERYQAYVRSGIHKRTNTRG
jgi:hypothetical protein